MSNGCCCSVVVRGPNIAKMPSFIMSFASFPQVEKVAMCEWIAHRETGPPLSASQAAKRASQR